MTMFSAAELADFRALVANGLDSSCALQSVNDSTGARTTLATVGCRTEAPSAAEAANWLGDDRLLTIVLAHDALDGLAGPDLVVLDGATTYRVRRIDPKRTRAVSRRLIAVESREAGGPV